MTSAMPEHLVLSENEQVIRSYEASILDRPKATGYLVATNRRLMFVGESSGVIGASVLHREVAISHVTGLYAYYDTGRTFGTLVFAAILAVVFILLGSGFPLFFIGLAWPAYLVYRFLQFRHAQLQVNILADGTHNSPIAFGQIEDGGLVNRVLGLFGASGNNAWMSVIAGPGRDALAIVREVGALVLDIQTLGDHALEKWSRPAHVPTATLPESAASSDPAPSENIFLR